MMDLLVQITTAHKLSPGSHAIHAIGDCGVLPYKPSTPIGEYLFRVYNVLDKLLSFDHKTNYSTNDRMFWIIYIGN